MKIPEFVAKMRRAFLAMKADGWDTKDLDRLLSIIESHRQALEKLHEIGAEGMKPDYREWLCTHDKVAQIARAELDREV